MKENNIEVQPVEGTIKQCINGSEKRRIGIARSLTLENGSNSINVDLEVADLSGSEKLIIGIDLFKKLGFGLSGVPFTVPQKKLTSEKIPKVEVKEGQKLEDLPIEWREVLEVNQKLPLNSRCKLEGAELSIETCGEPVWIRQYPIAEGYRSAVSNQVEVWKENGTIIPAPPNCKWNLPLLAVKKPSKDGSPDGVRVCLDARPLNAKILKMPDSNLPGIREIQDALGKFEWITVIDLADSYHQFPITEKDMEKTSFTWNGKQWMFTGVPFGLKIMTGHMQRIMEKLLGKHGRLPFQDDVAIATSEGGSHTSDVLEVLKALTFEAGSTSETKKV